MEGRLYVVSGPSGSGKSTIIEQVRRRVKGLGFSVSHTTRGPRGSERDGVEYHFVEREQFEEMVEQGAFAEWARVYEDYYGTSLAEIRSKTSQGLDVIMDLDVQGAVNIRRRIKESVLIFVLPPSKDALECRLRERGTDEPSVIAVRVEKAAEEIAACSRYDYIIVNDRLEQAVEEMAAVILAERCRTASRLPEVASRFPAEGSPKPPSME